MSQRKSIRDLRMLGLSIGEIAVETGQPKGTIRRVIQGIKLNEKQKLLIKNRCRDPVHLECAKCGRRKPASKFSANQRGICNTCLRFDL